MVSMIASEHSSEFLAHSVHERNVDLMVEETVYFNILPGLTCLSLRILSSNAFIVVSPFFDDVFLG